MRSSQRAGPLAGLGDHQCAGRKLKRRQVVLSLREYARLLPVEPAGDRQVKHQVPLVREVAHDPLAEVRQLQDPPAGKAEQVRLDGP